MSSFHLHHLHHLHHLSCDADFWTRHVGIFKVAVSIEACRINQEAKVFSGGVDDCQVKLLQQHIFCFFSVQVIHLFGPTNLIANGPKIFTLKETSKRAFGMVSPWARYQKGFVTSHFTLHKPLYKVTED